jgi:hypothetical protein
MLGRYVLKTGGGGDCFIVCKGGCGTKGVYNRILLSELGMLFENLVLRNGE